MTSQFTNSLKIETGETFQKSLKQFPLYFFIGGTEPWEDDQNPPPTQNSINNMIEFYGDVVGLKRICGTNLQPVIPLIEWEVNQIYDQYEDHVDLTERTFFVINSEDNIYKCLSNYHRQRTFDEPKGREYTSIRTKDGYLWKYMYSLKEGDRESYKDTGYIPCYGPSTTLCEFQKCVQDTTIDGSIELIRVLDGGYGYSIHDEIIIEGDGYDCYAKPIVDHNGTIVHIEILKTGYDYRNAFAQVISKSGSGAMLKPIISPIGGHGSNAVEELCAINMMVDVKLEGSENNILPTDIQYRKIGILAKPLSNESGYTLRVGCPNKFSIGDQISGQKTSAHGIVKYIDYDNSLLYVSTTMKFEIGELLQNSNKYNQQTKILNIAECKNLPLSESVANRDNYLPYSGKLLWFQNIKPVTRSEDKIDSFKFIVSF